MRTALGRSVGSCLARHDPAAPRIKERVHEPRPAPCHPGAPFLVAGPCRDVQRDRRAVLLSNAARLTKSAHPNPHDHKRRQAPQPLCCNGLSMSTFHTIEINGSLVGILTADRASRSFCFHSGVAPYSLLDGSRFTRAADARDAVRRLKSAYNGHKNPLHWRSEGEGA